MSEFAKLVHLINSLAVEEKQAITSVLGTIEKNKKINDFKLQRIAKDKEILTIFLNKTISELEQQKNVVEDQKSQLENNLQELKDAYLEVEQFSYVASHDLKSPLRTIASLAQVLKKKNEDNLDDESKELVDLMVGGIVRMQAVINDLLDYSRINRNNSKKEPTDFSDLIHIVKFNLSEFIKENNVTFVLNNELPTLLIHRMPIIQLFQNLIGNAIKFRSEKDPVITISINKTTETLWEFQIADNGVGMDVNSQEKAFLPFHRLNNSDRPGTGIGLAICKKTVSLHNGSIRYESELGKGTTFIFTLENDANSSNMS